MNHSLYVISQIKPFFNLKTLALPNPDLSNLIKIERNYLQFKLKDTRKIGSLFLNPLIQNMVIEWYINNLKYSVLFSFIIVK
jgi:hypothetical protein